MPEVLVVGAGLSGMFAGALAARRGLDTTVIAQGIGGTHTGTGCIDLHSYQHGTPLSAPAIEALPSMHPYRRLQQNVVARSLAEFAQICADNQVPLAGHRTVNLLLPTALGAVHATCLAQRTMLAGNLAHADPIGLVRLPGFRDFYPELMAANLASGGREVETHIIDLPLPHAPDRRAAFATDLALRFDNPDQRRDILTAWRTALQEHRAAVGIRIERMGVPAILGLRAGPVVLADVERACECRFFEIPILPPSVPGIRLFNALQAELQGHGGRLVLGPTVRGKITRHGRAAITAQAAGHARDFHAEHVVLASGAFAGGGLVAEQSGAVRESVFDLPVAHLGDRSLWTSDHYFESHPYARFGLRVDVEGRPVAEHGGVIATNLWACGSILAGADRQSEGSREGIGLATAYAVIERIMHGRAALGA